MEIKAVLDKGIIRVTMEGRLDMGNAMTAEQAFLKYAESGSVFEVDMSGVDFISSAGVRALLTLYRVVAAEKGSVTLVKPQPEVLEVLHETGFDTFFIVKQ